MEIFIQFSTASPQKCATNQSIRALLSSIYDSNNAKFSKADKIAYGTHIEKTNRLSI